MRKRRPVDSGAAESQAVDYLLREFKKLPTKTGGGAGTASTGSGGGPIETTVLVAAWNSPDRIKAVADFVCDGYNDEDELNAANDMVKYGSLGGVGRVQLSSGSFWCKSNVTFNVMVEGVGRDDTFVGFTNGSYLFDAAFQTYVGCRNMKIAVAVTDASIPRSTILCYRDGVCDNIAIDSYPTDPFSTYKGAVEMLGGGATLINSVIENTVPGTPAIWTSEKSTTNTYDGREIIAFNEINSSTTGEDGILVQGHNVKVIGNTILGGTGDGVRIIPTHAGYYGGFSAQIIGNTFYDAGRHGISVESDHTEGDTIIQGNRIHDAGVDGIYIGSGALDTVVGPNRITGSGGVDINNNGTGTILIPGDASDVSPLTTKGDLWGYDTADNRLPVGGTNGHILIEDSTQALGVKWAANVKEKEFFQTGALTIGSGTIRYYTQTDRVVTGVYAMVSGAPVTSPAIFDVNMDGATTIFTTQANRPEIAAAAFLSAVEVPDVTAWDAGSYLLIDVDAANSATDLILVVQYTEA